MRTEKEIRNQILLIKKDEHDEDYVQGAYKTALEWVLENTITRYVCPYDRAIACDMKDGCLTCEDFNGEKHNED